MCVASQPALGSIILSLTWFVINLFDLGVNDFSSGQVTTFFRRLNDIFLTPCFSSDQFCAPQNLLNIFWPLENPHSAPYFSIILRNISWSLKILDIFFKSLKTKKKQRKSYQFQCWRPAKYPCNPSTSYHKHPFDPRTKNVAQPPRPCPVCY